MGAFRRWLQDTTIHGALIQASVPLLFVVLLIYFGYGYLVGHGSKDTGTGKAPAGSAPASRSAQSSAPGPPPRVLDRSLKQGENARAELRESFGLRALVPEEDDLRISGAPRGAYRFADIAELQGYVNTRSWNERYEFRLKRGRLGVHGQIEVHKLQDASIRLIGFVTRDAALQLAADARKIPRFTLYSVAWPNADYLVSLRAVDVKAIRDIRFITYDGEKVGVTRALDLELNVPSAP